MLPFGGHLATFHKDAFRFLHRNSVLPLFIYYILYWAEQLAVGHSAFDYEAEKESEEVSYFVVRKRFAWSKWYWKKKLPAIDRSWFC